MFQLHTSCLSRGTPEDKGVFFSKLLSWPTCYIPRGKVLQYNLHHLVLVLSLFSYWNPPNYPLFLKVGFRAWHTNEYSNGLTKTFFGLNLERSRHVEITLRVKISYQPKFRTLKYSRTVSVFNLQRGYVFHWLKDTVTQKHLEEPYFLHIFWMFVQIGLCFKSWNSWFFERKALQGRFVRRLKKVVT